MRDGNDGNGPTSPARSRPSSPFDDDDDDDGSAESLKRSQSSLRSSLAVTGGHFRSAVSLVSGGIDFLTRNGAIRHATPVGPKGDRSELEYVSALHQSASQRELRQHGAISAGEIAAFLKSRYGLDVDGGTVQRDVLERGLVAGASTVRSDGGEEDDGSCEGKEEDGSCEGKEEDGDEHLMDLTEMASALVIPNLLRLRRRRLRLDRGRESEKEGGGERDGAESDTDGTDDEHDDEGGGAATVDVGILSDVLSLVLSDVTSSPEPKPLNADLVRDILRGYGESDLAEDSVLVEEMVQAATPAAALETTRERRRPLLLDAAAFIEALTSDVARTYHREREKRITTNFDDVWRFPPMGGASSSRNNQRTGGEGGDRFCDEEQGTAPACTAASGSGAVLLRHETFGDKVWQILRSLCRRILCRCRQRRGAGAMGSQPENKHGGSGGGGAAKIITRLYIAPSIDFSADTYRARSSFSLLYVAFVCFYAAYLYSASGFGGAYMPEGCEQDGSLGMTILCPLIGGIVNPLIVLFQLVAFGTPFICTGSSGNSIDGRETVTSMLVCSVFFFLYTTSFWAFEFDGKYLVKSSKNDMFNNISFAASSVVLVKMAVHIVMIVSRRRGLKGPSVPGCCIDRYFRRGVVANEARIKNAALVKVDRMLHRAHGMHLDINGAVATVSAAAAAEVPGGGGGGGSGGGGGGGGSPETGDSCGSAAQGRFLSSFGRGLLEFAKLEGFFTAEGGMRWTWRKIWDGTLFTEEGIWISNRIVAGTTFQFVVTCLTPLISIYVLRFFKNKAHQDSDNEEDSAEIEHRLTVSTGVGAIFALSTGLFMTAVFIPSVVSTTLKLRRGVLPSLHDQEFLRYRFSLDQVTLLIGGMFWGVLISCAAVAVVTGGFVYLLMWPRTQGFLFERIGNYVGLILVIVSRILILQFLRATFFAAFYRRRPLSANVLTVALECYSLAISIWFMIVRVVKLIIICAMYLGRVDTPLLAPGVGMFGPIEIDNWPTVTRKEILIHEAHRHPYVETLGYLYMMQLRYRGGGFARRSGSAWRLIFISALMPWLHKYRELARPGIPISRAGEEREDDDAPLASLGNIPHGNILLPTDPGEANSSLAPSLTRSSSKRLAPKSRSVQRASLMGCAPSSRSVRWLLDEPIVASSQLHVANETQSQPQNPSATSNQVDTPENEKKEKIDAVSNRIALLQEELKKFKSIEAEIAQLQRDLEKLKSTETADTLE